MTSRDPSSRSPALGKSKLVVPLVPSWREEYSEALRERDAREQINREFIDAYTRLADRTAALEAAKVAASGAPAAPAAAAAGELSTPREAGKSDEGLVQIRSDLAEAIRSKGLLQTRLKATEQELERYKSKNKTDSRMVKDLSAERAVLIVKVRDRDEELRGKAKLLEEVQDEMISLNLQLNMAEQRSKNLQKENKDLVDRWMARMGQEADAMNDASKFS